MSIPNVVRNREERKTINETCLWSDENKKIVHQSIIVNESASGMLLETEHPLNLGDQLHLLTPCFGEPLTPENLTARQLIQYPITRKGTIVRLAGNHQYGIQFDDENKPAEFRRWYRESSTIYTLLTKKVLVVVLEGEINLETSALLQSLINNCKSKIFEYVFSLEKITSFIGAAPAIIKSVIKTCSSNGLTATVLYNLNSGKTKQIIQDVKGNHLFSYSDADRYELSSLPLPKFDGAAIAVESAHIKQQEKSFGNEDILFLVVCKKQINQNQLSKPITEAGGKVITVSLMHDAVNKILEYHHHFVIVDVELEELNLLVMLNQIVLKRLDRMPELIICGPKHVNALVKEALKLPVNTYIEKPYTDREYIQTIQAVLERKRKE